MSISLQAFEGPSTKSLEIAFTASDGTPVCNTLDLVVEAREGLATGVLNDCSSPGLPINLGSGVAGFNFRRGSSATISFGITNGDGSAGALIMMIERNPRKWYIYTSETGDNLLSSGTWKKVKNLPATISMDVQSITKDISAFSNFIK